MKYAYLLPALIVAVYSCKSPGENKDDLAFKPSLHESYQYAFTKTSLQQFRYNKENQQLYDTVKIGFTIQNNLYKDSINVCRLTFNDFVVKKPPIKITFTAAGMHDLLPLRNPFVILDSLTYYIEGLSVNVHIDCKGVVKQVNGADDLIRTIARRSGSPEREAHRLLSDYVSSDAITDVLNRIFSVPPSAAVNTNEIWGRELTLNTKAPVKLDNLYTFKYRHGDTACININAARFARQSYGDVPYMKGQVDGNTVVSYSTGMPFSYETTAETRTTTNAYIITENEEITLYRVPQSRGKVP